MESYIPRVWRTQLLTSGHLAHQVRVWQIRQPSQRTEEPNLSSSVFKAPGILASPNGTSSNPKLQAANRRPPRPRDPTLSAFLRESPPVDPRFSVHWTPRAPAQLTMLPAVRHRHYSGIGAGLRRLRCLLATRTRSRSGSQIFARLSSAPPPHPPPGTSTTGSASLTTRLTKRCTACSCRLLPSVYCWSSSC